LPYPLENRFEFFWIHHHIILDGWSTALILGDIARLYDAYRAGEACQLEPPRPYGDFVSWFRRRDPERAKAFWKRQLAGFKNVTSICENFSRPRGVGSNSFMRTKELTWEAGLTRTLQAFARRHQLTLSTIVHGAWALCYRYPGMGGCVVGSTMSGRPAELEGSHRMVGLFINVSCPSGSKFARRPRCEWLQSLQRLWQKSGNTNSRAGCIIQEWSEIRNAHLFESIFDI